MTSALAIVAIVLTAVSGLPGLFLDRNTAAGERFAATLVALGGACGLASGLIALLAGGDSIDAAWQVPAGRLAVGVDAIAALFVVSISLLSTLGAIYGLEYWSQASHRQNGRKLRAFYGINTAGMLLLVIARNAILFLFGWEMMALAAFLLISTEDERAPVRQVGLLYLVSTRIATLALFAMFALLFAATGTLDYAGWPRAFDGPTGDAIFVLAMVGFGLKAGMMPLHVWLPGAHASSPSHVSAVMSGVLIKMGIYGLVRITSFAAHPPLWWGETLIAAGMVSGVLGVGFAIGQHDLKRLLAYHSVENIGIILLGLGVAVLGRSLGRADLIALGLAGALLHTWNHGLFKGLLFLAAGSVLHATGTREIDRLGGLWRRMPRTGLGFVTGAAAICGLPPLNGLVSELLVYLGLFRLAQTPGGSLWLVGVIAAPALALIGALALACFAKAFGAVFLGEPRSPDVARAHEAGPRMLGPMVALGAACAFIGIGSPLVAPLFDRATAAWSPGAAALRDVAPLGHVAIVSASLAAATALVAWLIARGTRDAPATLPTWDCGYALPTARMQYTSSSFADMLVRLLAWALRPERHAPDLRAHFPSSAHFSTHVPDTVLDRAVNPIAHLIDRVVTRLRPIQRGNVHIYLLYILGTLIVLLLWR